MKGKKILSILLILGGVVLFGFATYIQSEVDQGKTQISSAQSKVDTGETLFSLNPTTKEVGKGIFGGIQKKIDEGKGDVAYYENLAKNLRIAGIIVFIAGVIFFVFNVYKKR